MIDRHSLAFLVALAAFMCGVTVGVLAAGSGPRQDAPDEWYAGFEAGQKAARGEAIHLGPRP